MGQTLRWEYTTSDDTNKIGIGERWSCTFKQVYFCLLQCYFQNTIHNRVLQYRLEVCMWFSEWMEEGCKTVARQNQMVKSQVKENAGFRGINEPHGWWDQALQLLWVHRNWCAAYCSLIKSSHSTTAYWKKSSHLTLDVSTMRWTSIICYLIGRRNELRKCLFIYWLWPGGCSRQIFQI